MAAHRLRGGQLHGGRAAGALPRDAGRGADRRRRVGRGACGGSRTTPRSRRSARPSGAPSGPSRWSGPGSVGTIRRKMSPTPSRRPCAAAAPRRRASRRSWPSASRRPCRMRGPPGRAARRCRFRAARLGSIGEPYKSDLTRVLVTGKVTPKFETIYRTVLAAQERAIAAIRPGARAHDIDAEARSVIEAAGFGGFFDHGLGHGIGMDIHEAPRIRKESPGCPRTRERDHGRAGDLPARLGRHPDRGRCPRDPRRLRGPLAHPQVDRLGSNRLNPPLRRTSLARTSPDAETPIAREPERTGHGAGKIAE